MPLDTTAEALWAHLEMEEYADNWGFWAQGCDGEHGDWFWMKRLVDGTVEAEGRVEGCISCHEQAAARDDLLRRGRVGLVW